MTLPDPNSKPLKADSNWRKWISKLLPNRPSGLVSSSDDATDEADVAVLMLMPEPQSSVADSLSNPTRGAQSGRKLALLLMAGAVFSKALGFVREISMAHVFGASMVADGFRAAITGTMLPLALLQNESVPTILIPMHREWQDQGDAPKHFAALTVALSLVGLAIMSLVIGLGALFVRLMVGGFSAEAQQITLDFLRVMALGMPASVMLNVLASGEIALGRSRLTTIRASLLNISVIVGLLILVLTEWRAALAWAFAFAFNALGVWGLLTLIWDGSLDFRGLRLAEVGHQLHQFWLRLRPLLAVPVADQANVWFERILASRLAVGAVASLDYARTITDSAVLFVSQPLGLALLSSAPTTDYNARMQSIARPLLAIALPASVCLGMFAPDLARLVFSRGAFNEAAVQLTSQAMRGIAIGLWATTLGWILLRLLNSVGRNKTAALILVMAYLSNLATNLVFSTVPALHDFGPFLLGFSETVRGFVLLFATTVAMRCSFKLLYLLILAAIPATIMAVSGFAILEMLSGSLQRLGAAGVACFFSCLIGGAVLSPHMTSAFFRKSMKFLNRITGGTL